MWREVWESAGGGERRVWVEACGKSCEEVCWGCGGSEGRYGGGERRVVGGVEKSGEMC